MLSPLQGEEDSLVPIDEDSAFTTGHIFTNLCTSIAVDGNEAERETMISLLFKVLQKQRPNDFYELINQFSVRRQMNEGRYARIGDAYYFITNIFYLSSQMSDRCRSVIEKEIDKIKTEYQQRVPVATKTTDLTVEQK